MDNNNENPNENNKVIPEEVWQCLRNLSVSQLAKILIELEFNGDELACEMGKNNQKWCFWVNGFVGGLLVMLVGSLFYFIYQDCHAEPLIWISSLMGTVITLHLLYRGVVEAGSKGFCRVLTGLILTTTIVGFIGGIVNGCEIALQERPSYRNYYSY